MGMRKFGSAAPPFSKVAYVVKKELKIRHNAYNAISYKFLIKLNCFRPLVKRGGTIIGLAQL